MFSNQLATPRSNGFKAVYLLPSHWPLTFVWLAFPPDVKPPLKDLHPVPRPVRGLLWLPGIALGVLIAFGTCASLIEPVRDVVFFFINGWTYRLDAEDEPYIRGLMPALIIALAIIAIIPASVQATIYTRRPCGIFHGLSIIEQVLGVAIEAPFRLLKKRIGGESRVIEQFDVPATSALRVSDKTPFADAWLCAPNADTRLMDDRRPLIATRLRHLFVTQYFFRTTFGVYCLYAAVIACYPLQASLLMLVAGPVFYAANYWSPLLAWPFGVVWVVATIAFLVYAGLRILHHADAYAQRAAKRVKTGKPPEPALVEGIEMTMRRRFENWWATL